MLNSSTNTEKKQTISTHIEMVEVVKIQTVLFNAFNIMKPVLELTDRNDMIWNMPLAVTVCNGI